MRFSTFATTLLASATVVAAQQPPAYTTSIQTWTLTKTVERVVETVTATRNTTIEIATATSTTPLSTASAGFIPLSNGTSTVLGTGTGVGRPDSVPTGLAESGAEKVGLQMLGLMAVAGLVGFAGL